MKQPITEARLVPAYYLLPHAATPLAKGKFVGPMRSSYPVALAVSALPSPIAMTYRPPQTMSVASIEVGVWSYHAVLITLMCRQTGVIWSAQLPARKLGKQTYAMFQGQYVLRAGNDYFFHLRCTKSHKPPLVEVKWTAHPEMSPN